MTPRAIIHEKFSTILKYFTTWNGFRVFKSSRIQSSIPQEMNRITGCIEFCFFGFIRKIHLINFIISHPFYIPILLLVYHFDFFLFVIDLTYDCFVTLIDGNDVLCALAIEYLSIGSLCFLVFLELFGSCGFCSYEMLKKALN